MRGWTTILDGMQARMRRVPLKRRIAITMTLYLLAVVVMAVAGARVAALVRQNRTEVTALHARQQTLATMGHSINLLQVLGSAYLRGGDTVLPARIGEEFRKFESLLETVMPDAAVLDGEPLQLSLSVNGFM